MNLQEELNSLPVSIYKTGEVLCPTCNRPHKTILTYKLKIDVSGCENFGEYQHRYKVYYYCCESWNNKYIGTAAGFGKLSLSEAIAELKEVLKGV